MNDKESNEIKVLAARRAIEILGGRSLTAEKISAMSGKKCSRHSIRYWEEAGVPAKFCPAVHQLTKIPLTQLDPEVYPVYLFAS